MSRVVSVCCKVTVKVVFFSMSKHILPVLMCGSIIIYSMYIVLVGLSLVVDTVNTKAKQHQECETLITRIEVRIMRLRREKGDRIKGALQATRDPNVPNNNTGIILSIMPVLILVIIYYSSKIENTASIIYYCTFTILML